MTSFEDLEVWKKARELRVFVFQITKNFPVEEKFGLTSQIRRSSRSVTNNIAEGFGRYHFQENIQFCRQARGSLAETLDHIIIAGDENFISNAQLKQFRVLYNSCLKLLNGYIAYLKKAKQQIISEKPDKLQDDQI